MWKCNVSVERFESDTCTAQGLSHHTDFSFMGGRWSITGKCIFLFHLAPLTGGLCVSLAMLSTKWPVQCQPVKANVFFECLYPGVPLNVRLMGPGEALWSALAQIGLIYSGQVCKNTHEVAGVALITKLPTAKQHQVPRCKS